MTIAQNALAVKTNERLTKLVDSTVKYETAKSGQSTIHELAKEMKEYFALAGDGVQSLETLFTIYDGHCRVNGLKPRAKQRITGMMALTEYTGKFPMLTQYGETALNKTFFRWIDSSRFWKGEGFQVKEDDAKGKYSEYFASPENFQVAINSTLNTRKAGQKGGARVGETIAKKKTADDRKEYWRQMLTKIPAEQYTEIRSVLNSLAKEHKHGEPPIPSEVEEKELKPVGV